jgi:hypothetical protein
MRLFLCAALSAATLIAATGCGSDDEPPTTAAQAPGTTTTVRTGTTPSQEALTAARKRFIERVNPICDDYNGTIRSVQKQMEAVGRAGNVDVFAPALERATKAAQRASERFDAVAAPAEIKEQAALIGRALQGQVKGNQLLLDAAKSDDPQQFGVAREALNQVTPRLQELMRSFGMTVCGAAG